MFRFTEPSSDQFSKHSTGTLSKCAHCGIPYCLQIILPLRIMWNSVSWRVIWNINIKNSCQYVLVAVYQNHTSRLTELWSLPKPAQGLNTNNNNNNIYIYILLVKQALVRWGFICLQPISLFAGCILSYGHPLARIFLPLYEGQYSELCITH